MRWFNQICHVTALRHCVCGFFLFESALAGNTDPAWQRDSLMTPGRPGSSVWLAVADTASGPELLSYDSSLSYASRFGADTGHEYWLIAGERFFTTGGTSGAGNLVERIVALDIDGDGPGGMDAYAVGMVQKVGSVTTGGVARWDGTQWTALGTWPFGTYGGWLQDVAVFDDGSGPALYACGHASGVNGTCLWKLDNGAWGLVGSGLANGAYGEIWGRALELWDDGNGPKLYLAGSFGLAGQTSPNLVSWDGTNFAAVGTGLVGDIVDDLAVLDEGSGTRLFASGDITSASGDPTIHTIARWDGVAFSAVLNGGGQGISSNVTAYGPWLRALDLQDGAGPALYVLGNVSSSFGAGIHRWDGTDWTVVPDSSATTTSLEAFDPDGSGPEPIRLISGTSYFDGSAWLALPNWQAEPRHAKRLTLWDNGGGEAIFGVDRELATFDGAHWTVLGPPVGDLTAVDPNGPASTAYLEAIAAHDDGSGPALYIAGDFTHYLGSPVGHVIRYDGTTFSPVATGISSAVGHVPTLVSFDDGSGSKLYAAGYFWNNSSSTWEYRVSRWDGVAWNTIHTALGSTNHLAVLDDGSGPALYAAGTLNAGGAGILKWNGTAFVDHTTSVGGSINVIAAYDDGSGPALFAGGNFTTAGGVSAKRVAKWTGSAWVALGTGLDKYTGSSVSVQVRSMHVHDDGNGPRLYVGGIFHTAGGLPARDIAAWDGSAWHDLDLGMALSQTYYYATPVESMVTFDDGSGPGLFVGGSFGFVGGADGFPSGGFAKWGLAAPDCVGDLNGDGSVDLDDLSILLVNFGTTGSGTPEQGDLNGDGNIDLTDLSMLLVVFGVTC